MFNELKGCLHMSIVAVIQSTALGADSCGQCYNHRK